LPQALSRDRTINVVEYQLCVLDVNAEIRPPPATRPPVVRRDLVFALAE
jgi:hypothetical protein